MQKFAHAVNNFMLVPFERRKTANELVKHFNEEIDEM